MAAATIDINKLLDIDEESGQPVIRGSRLRVITIAARHLDGRSPEEIAASYPNLSVAAVYAALAYYFEHKTAMDADEASLHRDTMAAARTLGAEII